VYGATTRSRWGRQLRPPPGRRLENLRVWRARTFRNRPWTRRVYPLATSGSSCSDWVPAWLGLVAAPGGRTPLPGVPSWPTNRRSFLTSARALLTVAATRGDHLIRPPKLPMVAARQVVRSLLIACGGGAGAGQQCGLRLARRRGRRGPHAAGDGPGARPGGRRRDGHPDTGANAAETWEPTGADAAPLWLGWHRSLRTWPHTAPSRVRAAQRTPIAREEADNGTPPLGETASAAVGAVQASTVTPRRGSRRSPLEQAAQTLLDAWTQALAATATPPTR
jgi:hypothetical protein